MIRPSLAAAALFLSLLPAGVRGAEVVPTPPYHFATLSQRDGLSEGTVRCIFQDRTGFMWFGTADGLNRYDGYRFTIFRPNAETPRGLGGGDVYTISEDRQGCIWAGTIYAGLYRYDPGDGSCRAFTARPGQADGLPSNTIRALLVDRAGTLWVGTAAGLVRLEGADLRADRFAFRRTAMDNGDENTACVNSLFQDRRGRIWIGTGGGLYSLDPDRDALARRLVCRAPPSGSRISNDVSAVMADGRGFVWTCSIDGSIGRLDPDSNRFDGVRPGVPGDEGGQPGFVEGIVEEPSGVMWFAGEGGLSRFDPRSGKFGEYRHSDQNPGGLPTDHLESIYMDRSGLIWIGTNGKGVCRFNPNRNYFNGLRIHPRLAVEYPPYAICEDRDGWLWFSGEQGYVTGYDRSIRRETNFRIGGPEAGIPADVPMYDQVRSMCLDDRGSIWAGTRYSGLFRLDRGRGRFRRMGDDTAVWNRIQDDTVTVLLPERGGGLWIGTADSGLFCLAPDSGTLREFPLGKGNGAAFSIHSLLEDRHGNIWAGSYNDGLSRLETGTGRSFFYRHHAGRPDSLGSDQVTALLEDRTGAIWVGTSLGLNRLDPGSGRFTRYGTADGLSDDYIKGIEEDGLGRLWLSTNHGLICFDPRNRSCRRFHEQDGLINEEFDIGAHVRSRRSGELFFGGVNGVTVVSPPPVLHSSSAPPLVLTDLTLNGVRGGQGGDLHSLRQLRLRYRESLSLEFAVLDFRAPQSNRYAYRFSGAKGDWADLGGRHDLTFAGLEAGRYVLLIRGADSEGVWNESGIRLDIEVVPPFWRRSWFQAALAVLLLAAFFTWHRTRMRRLRRRLRSQTALEAFFARHGISRREREILQLLVNGRSGREIEEQLFISANTVRTHVHNIYRKLKIRNRSQLVRLFQQTQLDDSVAEAREPESAGSDG